MKKITVALFLFIASITWISAQDLYTAAYLESLGLTQNQIQQILQIQNTSRNQIRESTLEMNIFKAQLEKMLYNAHPDMNKVNKLLEESLKYRLKAETAAIQARVRTREIMGEQAWEKMLQERKRIRQQTRNKMQENAPDSGKKNMEEKSTSPESMSSGSMPSMPSGTTRSK